ncbi:Neuromedin-B receptor [Trachymyrmex cornetzi]|uniref:Neuromedin-B receptor n=1 Tax=Trachymyrmex cornetzi TaxID=471704 RepID=A0A151JRX5_9HYME|nr:Neuromedin-B receptor [Trachymyrmex cornetzi]
MTIIEDIFNMSSEMEYDYEYDYVPVAERVETYIIPVIFLLILIVGVIGNGILILILLRHTSMRNIPNTYVMSLALGDLLFLSSSRRVIMTYIPFTLFVYVLDSWPWGLTICKLSEYAKDISIGVSVFTLAALSAESFCCFYDIIYCCISRSHRYCAIVNPIRRHVAGLSAKPLTVLTAFLIWVLAIVIAMPAVLFSEVTSVPVLGNRSILICNPFPKEFAKPIYIHKRICNNFFIIAILGKNSSKCKSFRKLLYEKIVYTFSTYHVCIYIYMYDCKNVFYLYKDHKYDFAKFTVEKFCFLSFYHRFNKYLCCCLPGGSTVCGRSRTESSITQENIFLQKSRCINETNASTARRRTQEFNSTGVFEMGSVETKPPVVAENRSQKGVLASAVRLVRLFTRRLNSWISKGIEEIVLIQLLCVCIQAPCLEDIGSDSKRIKNTEQYADPNTREYLQLALARVLELQREISEGTYVAEIDDGSDLNASGSEEDLTKEILTKVFHDLPGTPSSLAKIIDRETRWKNHRIDAIHSKRIQLLGFDTCRRMALEFMGTIIRESRNKSCSLNMIGLDNFSQNESLHFKDAILANDFRKRESNTHEIQARMLKSLDLHLAAKQRDYTSKLMKSGI